MNVKAIINWTLYVVAVILLTASGIWLWNEFSPHQDGPLAEVSYKTGGRTNQVRVLLVDEQQRPISSSLITIVTNKGEHDVTTNDQGTAERSCEGEVVTGLRVERLLVFSKSLAQIRGIPSLTEGVEFRVVVKHPDLLRPTNH
jgi:hypothetical protein